jgi:hypothetical protein
MKGPAESGQICSVGRRKIAKKIAKNKRCYANTKLNMVRSRVRPSTISRVLIAHTCFGRSGGLAPISLPLFQGV